MTSGGDHMMKVQSGSPLVIPAQAYNAFIDAAKDFQGRTQHLGQTATPGYRSAGIVLIKNESGDDRQRFNILGLGDPIFLPDAGAAAEQSFKNAVAFRGDLPDETLHKGKFVVLLEPLSAGAIGRAYLVGVTAARLRLEDSAQEVARAEIIDQDAAALQPAADGSAQVLWHQQQTGDVWAVVRLGNAAPVGVWVQITSTEANGGEYSSWQEVELTDDGQGGFEWTAVADGLAGPDDGVIFEVNGVEDIPADTVVQVFPNPAYDPEAAEPLPAWLFQYEQPEVIGFGVPADGEVDVPHDVDIDLTVTDAAGTPILDDQGQPQTIKVWRNAVKRSLYTDFDAGTVFVYVKFPQPMSGVGGCIFSRTEAFKNYREWLPPEGYSLYPDQQPPASTDVTGEPGNAEHVHVIGKMFMETDVDGKGWAPWFVIDPEALGAGKVKTDATDETPGYLDDEIQVGENPGQPHTWVHKRVNDEPAGPDANDHKLRLYHGDWDALNTNTIGSLFSFGAAGANVSVVAAGVDPGPGTAWFTFSVYEDEYDSKKHSKVKLKVGARKLVINGLGKVFTDGNDTVPGFLDAEVIVLPPGGGHNWITKNVTPGGVADNKLLIEHNDWDDANLQFVGTLCGNLVGGNGVEVVADPPAAEPYIEFDSFIDQYDDKRHSEVANLADLIGAPFKRYIKLPGKVKTDADDTTPGYLNDELIVDPGGGDPSWLEKSVTPGGAADNKLLIEHKDWDNDQTEHTVESLLSWEDHGGGVSLDISEPLPGWAWIQVETWRHKEDRKGHCDLIGRQPDPLPLDPIYLKWVAVPQGENTGDMLYWDGTKWVTLAAPSGGDFVLMSSGGAPYWQQVQEFECPGSGS